MPANRDEEATARDEEVQRLHPGKDRRHVRATLAGRVVLRNIEEQEDEAKIGLLTPAYLTAIVDDGSIEFYANASPVRHAGSLDTSRVVAVEVGHELDYTPPRLNPTLQLKLSEPGTEPLDLELEVLDFDGATLTESKDVDEDVDWWKAATGN